MTGLYNAVLTTLQYGVITGTTIVVVPASLAVALVCQASDIAVEGLEWLKVEEEGKSNAAVG